tara:strand:+ start:2866 stop:3234 length:369 start_codon:yes stop_codon:yes gene_type:complete
MTQNSHVNVGVEKVMELRGTPNHGSVYAHISKPINNDGGKVQYAMIAYFPQHGVMHLGNINPETREFELYDPDMTQIAFYERAGNHVVAEVSVPVDQLDKVKTLEDVLEIEGIRVERELFPK